MGEIVRLAKYTSIVRYSDGKVIGTSLGTNRQGKAELMVYRMGFLGLPTKDYLLRVDFTPDVLKRLNTFFDDLEFLASPIKALTNYLVTAKSINDARTLCSRLVKHPIV